MSETETLEQEVETVEPSAVEELINQITAGDLNNAEGSFKSILDDKMADALEAQRVAVGSQMFNGDEEEEVSDEDIVDEYIEDEEDETLELGAEDETGLDADIETSTEEEEITTEEEITAEEEAAVEEDEEILAELED
jgi:hypothetical protein